MIRRLVHVGVAVKDATAAAELFAALLGVRAGNIEEVTDQKVRTVHFDVGGGGIELLEPLSPDSPVAKFIAKRGEGVHHLSFEVDDIEAEIARLRKEGFQMVDERPRHGAGGYTIAFLHPRSTSGVLIEIGEKKGGESQGRE